MKRDLKKVMWILDHVIASDSYPKTATDKDWQTLIDVHYKYVKNNTGVKECFGCRKYFKVCNALIAKLNANNKK